MADVASYIAALVGLIGAIMLALPGARTTSLHRYGVGGLLSLAGTTALAAPATLRLAVEIEPIPHLVRAIGAALAMVGSYCLLGIVLHSTRSAGDAARLTRNHFVILVIWIGVVIGCLYLSGAPESAVRTPTDSNLWLTAFLVLRLIYTGSAIGAFLVLTYRTIRLPETTPVMRLGFQLALVATSTVTMNALWTVAVHLRLLRAPVNQDIAAVLLGSTLTTLSLAFTAPVWGPGLFSALTRLRVRRAQRALNILWAEVADLRAVVDITPMSSLPAIVRDSAVGELYRSWLALRDLQRAARPYVHPSVRTWATEAADRHGLGEDAASTIIDAAELGAALDAVRGGAAPRTSETAGKRPVFERRKHARRSTDTPPTRHTTPALVADARHLVQIGYALRHSPLVAAVRSRAGTGLTQSARRPHRYI